MQEKGIQPGRLSSAIPDLLTSTTDSTDSIAGYEIVDHIGLVSSSQVVPVQYVDVGTPVAAYKAFGEAVKAESANAVVGIRVTISSTMIHIYGTAVRVRKLA